MVGDNMPVGSIIIWAGDLGDLPTNWRECNGKSLKKADYAELYGTLGELWVKDLGGNTDFFNIPDLRGLFLRGVNGERADDFKDPDWQQRRRQIPTSSASVNAPGSLQKSQFMSHAHFVASGGGSSGPREALSVDTRVNGHTETKTSGGNETRPNNAYVYFIIKVRRDS